jgi:hypothetical protein
MLLGFTVLQFEFSHAGLATKKKEEATNIECHG